MIFYGDKQKSMLDEEQADELEAGELEAEEEPDEVNAESSIYDGCTDEELLAHIRSCEGDEALTFFQ